MGFTVRFMLGTFLVLLCFWSVQTTSNRPLPQVSNNESHTNDKLQEIEAQNNTQRIVANLKEASDKPKTEFSTEDNKTIDKDSVGSNLQKTKAAQEIARSIDIEKFLSDDFHNKNNVYTLPTHPDTEKFSDPDFVSHRTTHKHNSYSENFDYHAELTTPKSLIFDDKYKDTVESVDQQLEHVDSDEISSESESKESPNLDKLYEETKRNDTKADLKYIDYKNIIKNDTSGKNDLHKDVVVEAGSNLDFHSSYNHTVVIDEDDSGNNTIAKEPDEKKVEASTLSNLIPAKGDLDHAESSTSKSILTTRKSNILTKPPSNRNSSHILSNNIETETVKAINLVQSSTTEKFKGEIETEVFLNKTPIIVVKRPFMFTEAPRTESAVDANHINKKSEQLLQENQVIPVHVEAPPTMRNATTESQIMEITTTRTETTTKEEHLTETTTIPPQTSTVPPTTDLPTTLRTTTKEVTTQETTTTYTTEAPVESTTKQTTPPVLESTTVPTTLEDVVQKSTKQPETTETETLTSVITETSASPWTRVTTEATTEMKTVTSIEIGTTLKLETETKTVALEAGTTLKAETETKTVYSEMGTTIKLETETTTQSETTPCSLVPQSDATTISSSPDIETTPEPIQTKPPTTTLEPIQTTKMALKTETEPDSTNSTITTENTVRTSKEMVFREITTSSLSVTTEVPEIVTTEVPTTPTLAETTHETTTKMEQPETTTSVFDVNTSARFLPDFKSVEHTDSSVEMENATTSSEFLENTDPPEDNSGTIAAITISSIGAVCLILLAGLLVIMRKRQKRFNYGQRCTPVSLDDYSMDNVSVYNSVRRKGMIRGSKRSYGNPAFEDPVCVTHPLNFPALGRFASNLEDIKAEFEEIPQITARTNELPEGCDTKNRYANVIPLPETRVFLNLIDGYPNSDYINANYVTGPKNTKGYYIACQGPLQNTVDDFWRMIWEQQCKVILMLTHLFENGVEKCVDYLPPSEVLDCHRLFGDYQVTLKKREVKDKYIISSLQLKNMVSNSWREVTHFWYLGWPEKGVPSEANSLIAFLIEARSYMKSSSLDRKDVTNGSLTNGMTKNELNPVVVHCSPGTGRTGVVIACDIAIREFEQTRLVDVPRIVYKIRRDRASAVQTKEQYAFIYKVINLYATKLTGGALDSL